MYLWNVHNRENLSFSHGKGVFLVKTKSRFRKKKYLDFNAGGAVNSLGYGNKRLFNALKKQGSKIWHLSNYYENKLGEKFAHKICEISGFQKAFFVNSGTEGIEFAIKVARKFFFTKGEEKFEILSLKRGYHGRTLGALSTSSNEKYKAGFAPFCEGFTSVEEDLSAIEEKISSKTSAIIMEVVQGAEGMHFLGWDFLRKVRQLCDKKGILLILDEIQTGMGRLGKLFAFEYSGIKPDIMVISKGIAGGFPFGAVLSTNDIANCMNIGSHGGTFGGNLLGISVALETLSQISKQSFLENVINSSAMLEFGMQNLKQEFPHLIEELRGFGLMRGLKIKKEIDVNSLIATLSRQELLLCGSASGNVLRITPPLIIKPEEIQLGIKKIASLFKKINL